MSVYVDAMTEHDPGRWCHMVAGTLEELHAMAASIGMQRRWFQASPPASFPHYDLRSTKRAWAIERGAVEVDKYQLVAVMRRVRAAAVQP